MCAKTCTQKVCAKHVQKNCVKKFVQKMCRGYSHVEKHAGAIHVWGKLMCGWGIWMCEKRTGGYLQVGEAPMWRSIHM